MIAPAPILSLAEVVKIRQQLGLCACTSGFYDPLTPGHVLLLASAKPDYQTLVVFVNNDHALCKKKGRFFLEHEVRCQIVAAVRGVDYVVPFAATDPNDMTVCEALDVLRPDAFYKGGDRVDKATIPEWPTCERLGIEIVVPDNCKDNGQPHGSDYLRRWSQST